MKWLTYVTRVIFITFILFLSSCEPEQEEYYEIEYELTEYRNAYQVKGFKGEAKQIEIPSTFLDLPVLGISYAAFRHAKVETVIIPDTLEFIKSSAFYSLSIKEVIISEHSKLKSLDMYAFSSSSIKTVYIPKDTTVLWGSVDAMIEDVIIHPDHSIYQEIDDLIYSKDGTILYYIPNIIDQDSLIIPEGVTTIGYRAAEDQQNVKAIHLPSSLKTIEIIAFSESQIETVVFSDDAELEVIQPFAFYQTNLKSVQLPDTLKSIGEQAFAKSSLESIQLSASLESIGERAFAETRKLMEIEIPELVITIGYAAFYHSTLEHIVFLGNETHLNSDIFVHTFHLKSIEIPTTHPLFLSDDGILYDKQQTTLIHYPYQHPQTTFQLPITLSKIESRAFDYALIERFEASFNPHFKTIDGVLFDSDGKTLIKYPSQRKELTYQIPYGVISVESYAFSRTNHLETLIVSSSVTHLMAYSLSSASIDYLNFMPNSKLTYLGSHFLGWSWIKHLVIPKSVQVIENEALSYATVILLEFDEGFSLVIDDRIARVNRIESMVLPVQHGLSIQFIRELNSVYVTEGSETFLDFTTDRKIGTFLVFEDLDDALKEILDTKFRHIRNHVDVATFRYEKLNQSYFN